MPKDVPNLNNPVIVILRVPVIILSISVSKNSPSLNPGASAPYSNLDN